MCELEQELPHLETQEDASRLRLDIHLHLHYWHARLFAGRPFLLEQTSSRDITPTSLALTSSNRLSSSALLRQDSIQAAEKIVQLCQITHEKIGLARASYVTEFTSLRAAMLVLIARCITDMTLNTSNLLTQGLELIQQMSLGQTQAGSEARVLVALQRAIIRLHKRSVSTENIPTNETSFGQLRQWEMLWQQQSPDFIHNIGDMPIEDDFSQRMEPPVDMMQSDRVDVFNQNHEDLWSAIFNAQLDEFSLLPTIEGNFDYVGFSDLG